MTSCAIRAAGGASATHGDLAVTSKNTDPDSCTAERTSDSASVLIAKTLRRTTALSAAHPDTEAGSQDGRATTIAGLDVRARGPANQEAHEMSRWLTPAALICTLPMKYRQVGTAQLVRYALATFSCFCGERYQSTAATSSSAGTSPIKWPSSCPSYVACAAMMPACTMLDQIVNEIRLDFQKDCAPQQSDKRREPRRPRRSSGNNIGHGRRATAIQKAK